MRQAIIHPGLSISPKPVRPEPAEGPFMVRQAHHERFFAPNFAQWTIWVHACYPCLIGKLILHPLAVFVSLAVLPQLGMPPRSGPENGGHAHAVHLSYPGADLRSGGFQRSGLADRHGSLVLYPQRPALGTQGCPDVRTKPG